MNTLPKWVIWVGVAAIIIFIGYQMGWFNAFTKGFKKAMAEGEGK